MSHTSPFLTTEDETHLSLLATGHVIHGAITALFGLFPAVYVAIGAGMMWFPLDGAPENVLIGGFFATMGALFMGLVLGHSALQFYAAHALSQRKSYTLCLLAAGLNLMSQPLGTALGVFTGVVLFRPSVREAFTG